MDEAEQARMTARLEELSYEHVKSLAAQEGFPHTWLLGVHEWLGKQERKRNAPTDDRGPPPGDSGPQGAGSS